MRALLFYHYGDPQVLSLTEYQNPTVQDGYAVISVKPATVNPSDVKNVADQMRGTILPGIPGRDFSGVVVGGPSDWIGAEV